MNHATKWASGLVLLAASVLAQGRQSENHPARYNDALSSRDYVLGVILYDTVFQDPIHGPVAGVEIDHAMARYPSETRSLEPGDVIVRVNGHRVQNIAEFREQISASKGVVSLRVWDLRSHAYDNYPKIPLYKVTDTPSPAKPTATRDP
jgi:S1-C subfamily serine protease